MSLLPLINNKIDYIIVFADTTKMITPTVDSLLEAEKVQLNKRKTQKSKRTFLTSRALIKHWISEINQCSPEMIEICFDESKKLLAAYYNNQCVNYISLSHSGRFVAIIISLKYQGGFGIDIEDRQKKRDYKALSEHCFTAKEGEIVQKANNIEQAFYQQWTLKEALAKSTKLPLVELFSLSSLAILEQFKLEQYQMTKQYFISTIVLPIGSCFQIFFHDGSDEK